MKQFLRGIIPNHSHHTLVCFDEKTADAIDYFVELNENHKDHVEFPTGESKTVLDSFFSRIKDQIRIVKNGRKNNHDSRISAVGINRGWAYTMAVSWDRNTDLAIEYKNPFALLALCQDISREVNKLDDMRDEYAMKKALEI